MTLLSAYNSRGCVGRCDARCYNANCKDCTCICGGINHGVGRTKAMDNTRRLSDAMIEDYKEKHPGEQLRFRKNREVRQLTLFDL